MRAVVVGVAALAIAGEAAPEISDSKAEKLVLGAMDNLQTLACISAVGFFQDQQINMMDVEAISDAHDKGLSDL